MSRYLVGVTAGLRGDRYNYVKETEISGYGFTDCVFDAVWYENKMHAEIVRDNLIKKDYFPVIVSVENTIEQLDRENGYNPFYILRDVSDNRIVRKTVSPVNVPLFTDNLKNSFKFKSAAEAMAAIDDINHDTTIPYDLVVEMHHFDEFYREHSDAPWMHIYGGRRGRRAWLSGNPNIPEVVRNQARNLEQNYIMPTKEMYAMFRLSYHLPEIEKVIFSNSVTIVLWKDGTKTVVRCQEGETFDPEKGLAMAFMKKAFGNKGNYYDKVRNLLNNATYQGEEVHRDRKGCKDDIPFAKKTKRGTYMCPHCSRFVPTKHIEGKKGPFRCDKCGKKFNINWEEN